MRKKIVPYCPNPTCIHHMKPVTLSFYIKYGRRKTGHGLIQRYQCKSCGKVFPSTIFSIHYWQKKRINSERLVTLLTMGASIRSLARVFHVTTTTILCKLNTIGRNALALIAHSQTHQLTEDIVADDFESFCSSQYFPMNITIAVGKESQFVYGFSHALLRRKGRMTAKQKQKRAYLDTCIKLPSQGSRKSFTVIAELCKSLATTSSRLITLWTDMKKEYTEVLRSFSDISVVINHRVVSSRKHRSVTNDLFSVNYIDRELRKDLAAYHRESLCFNRNTYNALLRTAIYIVHHNYFKPYRINGSQWKHIAHAHRAFHTPLSLLTVKQMLFHARSVISRLTMREYLHTLWKGLVMTPVINHKQFVPAYILN